MPHLELKDILILVKAIHDRTGYHKFLGQSHVHIKAMVNTSELCPAITHTLANNKYKKHCFELKETAPRGAERW